MPATSGYSLRAILFADAVEYSRHVLADEQPTLDFVQRSFSILRELATLNGGEVLKTMGDGAMVEFDSARDAVLFALTAQDKLVDLATQQPHNRQILFRMGIHLGEVQRLGGDVFGHVVNVASRLEHLAEPGGLCISEAVFEQVRLKVAANYGSLGWCNLKGIPQPIYAYRVHRGEQDEAYDLPFPRGFSVSLIERVSVLDALGNELTPKAIKARALIGYLILNPYHHEIKTRLLALMWSNQDPGKALQEYRAVVRQVRTAFQSAGRNLFYADGDDVGLSPSRLQVDLLTLSDKLTEGAVPASLVEGEVSPELILSGVENVDQVFDAWLKVTRHRWRERLIELLETIFSRTPDDRVQIKHAASAILALDPTHEPAAQALMKISVAEGKNAAALRIYQALADVLASEYGIEPSSDTKAAMLSIRSGGEPLPNGRSEPRAEAPEGRLPVIEVRRFDETDQEDGKAHLLLGFRAETISCLIKFRDWVIIEEQLESPSGARGAGAVIDYTLQAKFQSTAGHGVVNITLSDAVSGRYVWSELYSLSLEGWHGSSGMVARKVAAVLDIYLSAERVGRHAGWRDFSLLAYDQWLQGENLLTLWQPDAELEAEKLFRSAIEQMPQFAPAYSSLASIYNVRHLVVAGFKRDPALETEALKLAQKAVQLDPLETRAHLTLAWSYAMAGCYDQADIHYELAFELNPNNPKTLLSCAHGLACTGRAERALELTHLAMSLTPMIAPYQWAYVSGIRFICADYAGSVEAAIMGTGSLLDTLAWKAAALALSGDIDGAQKAGDAFLESARSQWIGKVPQKSDIVDWFLDGLPIRSEETRGRLIKGLVDAGLPVRAF